MDQNDRGPRSVEASESPSKKEMDAGNQASAAERPSLSGSPQSAEGSRDMTGSAGSRHDSPSSPSPARGDAERPSLSEPALVSGKEADSLNTHSSEREMRDLKGEQFAHPTEKGRFASIREEPPQVTYEPDGASSHHSLREETGSASDRADSTSTPPRSSQDPERTQLSEPRAASGPRGSREYTADQLKARGKVDWAKERRAHTRRADRQASAEAAAATGTPTKVTGGGVEYHHHMDVQEAKRLGMNPDVAGERERMSALDSRRRPDRYGTIGDAADPGKGKRLTHHNIAKQIDKYEKARTAKAMGVEGDNPRLPKTDAGRAGLADASATSKWRLPANVDQAERAKHKWVRVEPVGPKVDEKTGIVIPDSDRSTSTPKAPAGTPSTDAPRPPGRADTPRSPAAGDANRARAASDTPRLRTVDAPKGSGKANAPEVDGATRIARRMTVADEAMETLSKTADVLGKAGKALGVIGNIFQTAREAREIAAIENPDRLPEGAKVELTRPQPGPLGSGHDPVLREPSGYTAEKTNGTVIYRGPDGREVTREEAREATSLTKEAWDNKT